MTDTAPATGEEIDARSIRELHNAAHRRPAFAVDAPLLSRHIGIKLVEAENPTSAPDEAEYEKRHAALVDNLNAYLKGIGCASQFGKRREDIAKTGRIEPTESLFADIHQHAGCRLRVRADIHNEYITVSLFADHFDDGSGGRKPGSDIVAIFKSFETATTPTYARASIYADQMFDSFWDALEWADPGRLGGLVFCDFRGIAICPPHVTHRLEAPDGFAFEVDLDSRTDEAPELDANVLRFIEKQKALIPALLDIDPQGPAKGANAVLSGILDGLAVYGSSLGNISHGSTIRYLVIYGGTSPAQLGRLMRRLHVLGELRTAALLDMGPLRDASRELRYIGAQLTRETRNGLISPESLAQLSAQMTALNGKCVGGLLNRINRSRVYASGFRERLQDLRVMRVEGWQTYEEFVRRNLFMEFEYVNQIGVRYDQLGQRFDRLRQALQIDQFRAHNAEYRHLQWRLVRFQAIAEVVGGGAFAYYVGTGLAHILVSAAQLFPQWFPCARPPEVLFQSFAGAFVVVAAVLYLPLRWWAKRHIEKSR